MNGPSPEGPEASCLVITDDLDFLQRVHTATAASRWLIYHVSSSSAALGILRSEPVPMVVYDSDLCEEDWRRALVRLKETGNGPCILLASRVASDYLWQEVIRNQGYDVLAKSAGPEELMRSLRFAWFWRRRETGEIPKSR